MAATRLSDAQKQEIVGRYRQGETSAALANAYGCSANTVSRVLKAALDPEDYERLKQQRGRSGRSGASAAAPRPAVVDAVAAATDEDSAIAGLSSDASAIDSAASNDELAADNTRQRRRKRSAGSAVAAQVDAPAADPAQDDLAQDEPAADGASADETSADEASDDGASADQVSDDEVSDDDATENDEAAEDDDGPGVLAIDDADDFGDDDEGDEAGDDADEASDDDANGDEEAGNTLAAAAAARELVQCQALIEAELPGSAYLLVDKTVELQPTPLRECTDLGPLPEEEADRQALQVYLNPRQAKRHCGRTQRVIPVPDVSVLERRASYLLRQGICRVVVEGALYALPEG